MRVLLRFAYAHVQMMLYRPFLQYYSRRAGPPAEPADERYLALATAGINVCRNIIHIGLEIRKQAVLIGPYWFITYTQFFAVLSLLLYVVNNPNQPGAFDLFADAKLGKDCISSLTQRSLAADRVTVALNVSQPCCWRRNARLDRLTFSIVDIRPSARPFPASRVLHRPGESVRRGIERRKPAQPIRPRLCAATNDRRRRRRRRRHHVSSKAVVRR